MRLACMLFVACAFLLAPVATLRRGRRRAPAKHEDPPVEEDEQEEAGRADKTTSHEGGADAASRAR